MTRQGKELNSKAMEQYGGDMIWSGSDVRWTGRGTTRYGMARSSTEMETVGEDGFRVEMN